MAHHLRRAADAPEASRSSTAATTRASWCRGPHDVSTAAGGRAGGTGGAVGRRAGFRVVAAGVVLVGLSACTTTPPDVGADGATQQRPVLADAPDSVRLHFVRASIQGAPTPPHRVVVIEGYAELPPGVGELAPSDAAFSSTVLVDGMTGPFGLPFPPVRSSLCQIVAATGARHPPYAEEPVVHEFRVQVPADHSCMVEPFGLRDLGVLVLSREEAAALETAQATADFLATHRDRVVRLAAVAAGPDVVRDLDAAGLVPRPPEVALTLTAVLRAMAGQDTACPVALRPDQVSFTDDVGGLAYVLVDGRRTVTVHFEAALTEEAGVVFRSPDGADLDVYCRG